ncbi:MAG: four helix bundle protein [Thermomicrobiales bacterium]|nr:four helix bundle protein [Thermomicrobiales bacterium]
MRRYEELVVRQRAIDLVDAVYRLTGKWPRDEVYRLTDQIRRAAISIPANIAEGHGRTGKNEFLHHLSIAYGSLMEVETFLTIAFRQTLNTPECYEDSMILADEVGRLLRGMMTALRKSNS